MTDNPKNNIGIAKNIRQKRLAISELIVFFGLIFSETLFFGLSFILYVLQLSGRYGIRARSC